MSDTLSPTTAARTVLTAPDGTRFRDLDHDGVMAVYENPTASVDDRVDDLLSRMTLAEKAGQMFQSVIESGRGGVVVEHETPDDDVVGAERYNKTATTDLLGEKHMTHFNVLELESVEQAVAWSNALQEAASRTRLGIPVTLSTDPRHAFVRNVGASLPSAFFSKWPEPLGLAALRDVETVREFADIARAEYASVGIRAALHPTVDLTTEPRWARQIHTFGEDAELASAYVRAYLDGFQGAELGATSVACTTKHFPGGGPQKNGEDAHFPYGREQVYPGDNFDYHLEPFRAAIAAGTAGIMPYYGLPEGLVLDGEPVEEVGFGFNKQILTGLLREKLGYDGVICTDWALVHGYTTPGRELPPKAWGMEHADARTRVKKILDAGADQLGGEKCPEIVVDLVESGEIAEQRIDESVRRLLRVKFALGLFDDPFLDLDHARAVAGAADAVAAGHAAQQRSITVLTNGDAGRAVLPLRTGLRVYAEGVDRAILADFAEVVDDAQDADIAILRVKAPSEVRQTFYFETFFHQGSLEFSPDEAAHIDALCRAVPTVVDVFLDRPAILTDVVAAAAAVTGSFGSGDRAYLEVLFGRARAEGRLPFELPSSMAAVERSREDVPFDTEAPLFPHGHGLTTTA